MKGFRGKYRFLSNYFPASVEIESICCQSSEAAFQARKTLATGNEELAEENTWGDTAWGTVNGVGENRLGKIPMKIRKEPTEERT